MNEIDERYEFREIQCRATELSKENGKAPQGQTAEEIHALNKDTRKSRDNQVDCKFCGRKHKRHKRNTNVQPMVKKCKECGTENHFAVKCMSRGEYSGESKPVHAESELDSDTC